MCLVTVTADGPESFNPQSSPQSSLHDLRLHSQGFQERSLRAPCFIAVFLRVEIQRCLNPRVTQERLDGLGLDLRLVHEPVAQAVTQVVKTEPLARLDRYAGPDGSRAQMIGDKTDGREGNTAVRLGRREDEIPVFGVGRPRASRAGAGRERNAAGRSRQLFPFLLGRPCPLPSVLRREFLPPPTGCPTSAAPGSPKPGGRLPRRSEQGCDEVGSGGLAGWQASAQAS